jgi:predicted O-methyltransferase YrrM
LPSVHRQTFVEFVTAQGWTLGAELGVDKGILYRMLLEQCPDLTLLGVDLFPNMDRSRRAFQLSEAIPDRAQLYAGFTAEASRTVLDGSLDFVFIDADHSYDSVKDDIARWAPKVRTGGWVGGHDYHPRKWPGVVKAVDEAFGRSVHQMPGTIWGVWK